MIETFKCPACAAPLEFEGNMMQKCRHCGSSVIVPSGVMRDSNRFGAPGSLDFTNLSELTGKALRVAEIRRLIQSGNKIQAIKIFRETFGVGLKEAKDAVEAIDRGESVDMTRMQIRTANLGSSLDRETVKKAGTAAGVSVVVGFLVIAVIIFAAVGAVFFFSFGSISRAVDRPLLSPDAPPRESSSDAKAAETLKFGGEGNGAGKFKDNRAVAVDGQGRIYSADYQGGKIQVFDADGKYLTQWTAEAKMILYDMTADREGVVYIAQNKGLFAYEGATGRLLHRADLVSPRGLALMPDGRVAATVGKGFAIFDRQLKKLAEFKDANQAADSTFGFEEIAADGDGLLYLITRTEKTVCKFSADGKYLDRFRIDGSPNAIAVDNRGRVFISQTSEISVFDADGRAIDSFRTNQAFGLAFNDAGELFVASRPFVVKYQLNF